MLYLCVAFSLSWAACFIYLLYLDKKEAEIRRRLEARAGNGRD
jgi:CcmD family protein